jgi:energy-coupling factor transporter transmembrane protein EcfT
LIPEGAAGLLANPTVWNHGVFLMASFIGTFYFPPLFFLHLIIIFARVEKLGTILKAAVYNYKSLLYMAALGFVFTYIFNTVTFSNYMKDVYSGDEEPSEMCDEVIGCVTTLYISGVVGESE